MYELSTDEDSGTESVDRKSCLSGERAMSPEREE